MVYKLFKDSPAMRDDYSKLTESSISPLDIVNTSITLFTECMLSQFLLWFCSYIIAPLTTIKLGIIEANSCL